MRKLIPSLCVIFLLTATSVNATLWDFFQGNLPSIKERAEYYSQIADDEYTGTYDQNVLLEEYLRNPYSDAFGAVKPFRPSGFSTTLASSLAEGGTETTLVVNSITLPDGTSLASTSFGDLLILTVGEGDGEEKIAVNDLNQSTKTFTIYSRGLEYGRWASSSANILQHLPGEIVYVSDDDHFLNQQYFDLESDQTVSGSNTFSGTNTFSGNTTFSGTITIPEPTADSHAASKNYADNIANQGAATSTETVAGICELATEDEAAASTYLGLNSPLCLQARDASSSPSISDNMIVVTESDGKINQGFLDLTEDFAFTGNTAMTNMDVASSTFTATTTFENAPSIEEDPAYNNDAVRKSYADSTYTTKHYISAFDEPSCGNSCYTAQTFAHGFGVTPDHITLHCHSEGATANSSSGFYDGSTMFVASTVSGSSNDYVVQCGDNGNDYTASSTLDATNITLKWWNDADASGQAINCFLEAWVY